MKKLPTTNYPLPTNQGFTLIETFVAIVILTTAIAGPLTLAQRSLASAIYSRDQITAFYFAQEAIEFVKNTRDENNIKGLAWLSGLQNCLSPNNCGIDATASNRDPKIIACPDTNSCLLGFKTDLYGYRTDWSKSNFTRIVKITPLPIGTDPNLANEALVSVTMSWRTGTISKDFTINDYIYNWHK